MKLTQLFAVLACAFIATVYSAQGQPTNKVISAGVTTLPSGKQINVVGVVPMHFTNGSDALVLNCQTDISIDDKTALRKGVDEIWNIFRKNVEDAKMTNGVIRITHPEDGGLITHSKGYGFVFEKRADGQWHCLQDEGK